MAATTIRPFSKVLRILGPKDDVAWERALVGIYDAIDQLGQVTLQQSRDITNIDVTPAAGTSTPTFIVLGSADDEDGSSMSFPLKGDKGDTGAAGTSIAGPPGMPGESAETEVGMFIPPSPQGSRLLTMMKWSGYYKSSDSPALPGFLNDYGGPSISGANDAIWTGSGSTPYPGSTLRPGAWFYGTPAPCIARNFKIYVNLLVGTSVTLTIYRGGSPTTITITGGSGAFVDTADHETFVGDQRIDCAIQSGVGSDGGITVMVSATIELWSIPGSGM